MKRLAAFILAAALVVPSAGCGYKLVRKGQLNETYYDRIKDRVSDERGLEWVEPVEVRIINRTQVAYDFGITGTPTTEIAGVRYVGVTPSERADPPGIRLIIEAALGQSE